MYFSHVGIVVQNMQTAEEFYTKVLGCKVLKRHHSEVVEITLLQAENQQIELLYYPNEQLERKEGVISHIAFQVDDIESEINRLKEFGVELSNDQPRVVMEGMKIFFFNGPDGEKIEFLQMPK